MKLEPQDKWRKTEFRCDLTRRLDEISQLNQSPYYDFYHHYIVMDKVALEDPLLSALAIRVPGGTVGEIWIDGNNKIVKIQIDRDYVVKTYPLNTHEVIAKFIGETIEII